MATGDITAITIKNDRYGTMPFAEMRVEGWAGKTVQSWNEGTLPASANATFDVTSEGYDILGVLGTTLRKVYGTRVIRQPSPNQALFDTTDDVADLIVRVALSNNIYNDDRSGGAGTSGTDPVFNSNAGYLVATDASETTATTNLTCSNTCTLDYPKVIGQWDYLTSAWYERVTDNFKVAFTARHGYGVRVCALSAIGTVSAFNTSQLVGTPARSTQAQNGLYTDSYQLDVTLANYTQAENITHRAIAYPVVGDENSLLDTANHVTDAELVLGRNEATCTCDKDGGLTIYAYVDGVGGGTPQASTDPATAKANPFASIGLASQDGVATVCRVMNNVDILGHEPTTGTPRDFWWVVEPDPDVDPTTIKLERSGTWRKYGQNKLRYKGFTGGITNVGGGWLDGDLQDRMLMIDGCVMQSTTTPTVGLAMKSYGCWFVNTTGMGTDDYADFSTNRVCYAFTGCTWTSNGGSGPCYTAVCQDKTAAADVIAFGDKGASNIGPAQTNCLYDHNNIDNITQLGSRTFTFADSVDREGISIVGNVLECSDDTASAALVWISADSSTTNINNIIVGHNTIVGQRGNLFYNDIGSIAPVMSNVFCRNNAIQSFNIKSDTFASGPDGARVGNWAMMNGVEFSDNVYDGAESSAFTGDYDGINVQYITSKAAVFAELDYTDEQSSATTGLGNGNYQPTAGGNLTGHNLLQRYMSNDLFGNPVTGSEIGAVQIPFTPTPGEGGDLPNRGISPPLYTGLHSNLYDNLT